MKRKPGLKQRVNLFLFGKEYVDEDEDDVEDEDDIDLSALQARFRASAGLRHDDLDVGEEISFVAEWDSMTPSTLVVEIGGQNNDSPAQVHFTFMGKQLHISHNQNGFNVGFGHGAIPQKSPAKFTVRRRKKRFCVLIDQKVVVDCELHSTGAKGLSFTATAMSTPNMLPFLTLSDLQVGGSHLGFSWPGSGILEDALRTGC